MSAEIAQTQKRYGTTSMMAAIFIGILFILMGHKAQAKGLILGSIFSVLNFVLMGEILPLLVGHSRKKSSFISLGSIVFRHGLLAIPLILALKMEWLDFAATVIGLFMVQIMIMGDHLLKLYQRRV
ncbi:MAG: ATP synthase subunit I [Deltaproteobacteria bacterium]